LLEGGRIISLVQSRSADFVIEGYVDPTEPLRDEGTFGYYTLANSAFAGSTGASVESFTR
jgi:3-polyprenyl-4-hydroxybenzoate decarboxylase